ncbi:MAG: pyridoxamine 5'-phosphate oxidase family protein [Acidimicrobiales bacterium]|jgi:nitroimidazol reductase NimA-like FMN-containing flavoprotein (pyridoxamine 5'-phosphate oxidase superfamily)
MVLADSRYVECDERAVFEELDPEDCLELLREEPVGRVALTAHALPVVLPVNFAVLDGDIVWRSAQGTKLNEASADLVVAFEADHYEPDRRQGWSVMVQGLAHVMTDVDELNRARDLPLESWTLEGAADRYVCLVPNIVRGMRIRNVSMN